MAGSVCRADEVSYGREPLEKREFAIPADNNSPVSRLALPLSLAANVALLGALAYLCIKNPPVATITTPTGQKRVILAETVNSELAKRHGEEVSGDLIGRELVALAAEESRLSLDPNELDARWGEWLEEPGTRARIAAGEVTEAELRERLTTLVLLDQLTWNGLTPPEQEGMLRQAFESNGRDFEQLHLRHIVVESKKDADDVTQRLVAGVDFGQLAQRFSLDPLTRDQGGDLGWKNRRDLSEDLRAFVFLLPLGAASPPIASPGGWHIFLVEERRDTFEDCKEQVRRELLKRMRPETLEELRERFKVHRSEGGDLLVKLRRPGLWEGFEEKPFEQPARGRRTDSSLNGLQKNSPSPSPAEGPGQKATPSASATPPSAQSENTPSVSSSPTP